MNRTRLKNYAPQARRECIQAITDRAAYYGLTVKGIEPISEAGDTAIIAGLAFPRRLAAKRRALEERIRRRGFAQVIEAMAYTWFNRLVAIRFMELHGYLGHGYRVLSHKDGRDVPEILEHAEHVELPGLDRDRVIEMKLDGNREAELYRLLLVAQCNALHAAMPFLFEKIDDETELLLPDNLLHTDSIVRRLVREIDEADWQQVEIIGWLYQFYISEKKDEVIGKVVRSEDIPAATQLFTPNWIVKYMTQNSIGRMWLATYPQSGLRAKMDYYIEPAEQTAEVQAQLAAITPASLDPETITVLDPACGSGHILVEAYDLLKEIYLERGYRLRDIPRLILKRNLYGLDIDDRAAQLAAFALLMKARADDRRIFDAASRGDGDAATAATAVVNVLAIQESAALDAAGLADALLNVKSSPRRVPIIGGDRLFDDLSMQPALMMSEGQGTAAGQSQDAASREEVIELVELFRQGKTLGSLISVPDELAAKLPAIGRAVNENLSSDDLYAQEAARTLLPFVQQADVLARKYDCVIANPPYMGSKGMNTAVKDFAKRRFPNGKSDLFAMFIERNLELTKKNGLLGFMTPFVWMFLSSYEKLRHLITSGKTIFSLIHPEYHAFFESAYVPVCSFVLFNGKSRSKGDFFDLSKFYGADLQPIKLLEAINNPNCGWRFQASSYDFEKIPGSPIAYWVSDNFRSLFGIRTIKDVLTCDGQILTGDNERFLRYHWEVNGSSVGACNNWKLHHKGGEFRRWYGNVEWVVAWDNRTREYYKSNRIARIPKEYIWDMEGITWSTISSSSPSFRKVLKDESFNKAAPTLSSIDSDLVDLLLACFNSNVVTYCLSALNPTLNYLVQDIESVPVRLDHLNRERTITIAKCCISIAKADWDRFETSWDFQSFPLLNDDLKAATVEASFDNWQAQCNANIKRMQELETENNRLFINAYGLEDELTPEVPEDQITLARADREADIKRLLSYAVGCVMGRYSLDQAGLVYAHSGNRDFDASRYQTFAADPDGIVPVMENDWFDDDAAHRFIEFVAAAWPTEHIEENLRFIAASLGANRNEPPRETIRRYFANGFFKDHLKTYKKRPIYWLFTSGRQRAFQALVYLHRYNDGTLARMRTEYVIPLQGKIAARIEHLAADINNAASTAHRRKLEKEREALNRQQDELRAFDEKLRHSADQRIALNLDDGVKVNYGRFGDLLADVKAITGGNED
jgi:Eco57I restriction-modification methylase